MPDDEPITKTLGKLCLLWIPALLSTGAFICSMVFSFWCESIQFETRNGLSLSSSSQVDDLHFGPWYQLEITEHTTDTGGGYTKVTTRKECKDWQGDPDIDSKWKTVRAFTIIVAILGGFATIALWFVPCRRGRISKGLWTGVALFYAVVLTLFQGLTFLIFRSNACDANSVVGNVEQSTQQNLYQDDCSWDSGSTANAVGIGLWFLTGLVMLVTGPPQMPDRPPPETQAVTYELETAEDGTQKPVERKVVKGTAVPTATAEAVPVKE